MRSMQFQISKIVVFNGHLAISTHTWYITLFATGLDPNFDIHINDRLWLYFNIHVNNWLRISSSHHTLS